MFYFCRTWQKGVTASCNNPRFSSSVRWGNTVQRFSVAFSDVWDYCVTANGDRATFTESAGYDRPIPVTGTISLGPKSTRSLLGHMTISGSSFSTFQKSVLLPSSKLDVVLCILCVCTVLVIEARGGSGG